MRIVYIGTKPRKGDNVAQTGLTWERGQIHEIPDEKAKKLLEHIDIWADADKPYRVADPADGPKLPEPSVTIIVPGAKFEIVQSAETVSRIARGELKVVFMTPIEEQAFAEWRAMDVDTAPTAEHGLAPRKPKDKGASQTL